jgi:hypothetical protein
MQKSIGIVIAVLAVMATAAYAVELTEAVPMGDMQANAMIPSLHSYIGYVWIVEGPMSYLRYGTNLTYNSRTRGSIIDQDAQYFWRRCLPLNYVYDAETCGDECEIGTCTTTTGETMTLRRSLTSLYINVGGNDYWFFVNAPPQDPPCMGLRSC